MIMKITKNHSIILKEKLHNYFMYLLKKKYNTFAFKSYTNNL